jgi:hypothetical protein
MNQAGDPVVLSQIEADDDLRQPVRDLFQVRVGRVVARPLLVRSARVCALHNIDLCLHLPRARDCKQEADEASQQCKRTTNEQGSAQH